MVLVLGVLLVLSVVVGVILDLQRKSQIQQYLEGGSHIRTLVHRVGRLREMGTSVMKGEDRCRMSRLLHLHQNNRRHHLHRRLGLGILPVSSHLSHNRGSHISRFRTRELGERGQYLLLVLRLVVVDMSMSGEDIKLRHKLILEWLLLFLFLFLSSNSNFNNSGLSRWVWVWVCPLKHLKDKDRIMCL